MLNNRDNFCTSLTKSGLISYGIFFVGEGKQLIVGNTVCEVQCVKYSASRGSGGMLPQEIPWKVRWKVAFGGNLQILAQHEIQWTIAV